MNNDRFFLERKHDTRTFPIFDDKTPVSKRNLWLLVVLPPILFAILVIPQTLWPNIVGKDTGLGGYLFSFAWEELFPLIFFIFILHKLAGQSLRSFFKKLTWSDIGDGIVAFVLGTIYTRVMSAVLIVISKNSMASDIATNSFKVGLPKKVLISNYINEILSDLVELLNEELLAIIPMLAAATLAYKYYHCSRKGSIGIGLLVSIFVFGLAHFSAYDWHLAQMFLVIGMGRFFDTGVYIRTKNLWVSYISHYLWDTAIFTIAFITAMNH